jgi:hypothetical protein
VRTRYDVPGPQLTHVRQFKKPSASTARRGEIALSRVRRREKVGTFPHGVSGAIRVACVRCERAGVIDF